jgi:hypothetical protein
MVLAEKMPRGSILSNMVFDKFGNGGSGEKARLAQLTCMILVAYVEPKKNVGSSLAGNSPVQPLMQNNFILPEEFEHHKLPKINICQGVPKLTGQSGQQFQKYTRDMQEARQAHLIECDTSTIPFLCALINHIKEHKLTALIWGGHAHITETVDWDSPKGDLSHFVRMSLDQTCYNMSVTSVKVRGIADIDNTANI